MDKIATSSFLSLALLILSSPTVFVCKFILFNWSLKTPAMLNYHNFLESPGIRITFVLKMSISRDLARTYRACQCSKRIWIIARVLSKNPLWYELKIPFRTSSQSSLTNSFGSWDIKFLCCHKVTSVATYTHLREKFNEN